MRRTSPWVYVAGVAVQLAALGLCAWAMERWLRPELTDEPAPAAEAPPAPAPPASPAPRSERAARRPFDWATAASAAAVAAAPPAPVESHSSQHPPGPEHQAGPVHQAGPEHHAAPERQHGAEYDQAPDAHATPPPHASLRSLHVPEPARPAEGLLSQPDRPNPPPPPAPAAPRFGPPPSAAARPAEIVPRFVVEGGGEDDAVQVLRGRVADGILVLGITSDGAIRCVDADGGRYSGQSESARARLREVDGSRAFTLQIGVDPGGALNASFTGGGHDGETISLAPYVEGHAS